MTTREAEACIAQLKEYFPNIALPAGTVTAWADKIAEYPADAIPGAIGHLQKTLSRAPYLADLHNALTDERDRLAAHRGRPSYEQEIRRVDTILTRTDIDPEYRDTLEHERADLQRDLRQAAQEAQRQRDAQNQDRPDPTRHLHNP